MLARLVVDIVEHERRGVAAVKVIGNQAGRAVLSCRVVETLPLRQVFHGPRVVWKSSSLG